MVYVFSPACRFAGSWALLKLTTLGCSSRAARERICGWIWGTASASRWIMWRRAGWGCGSSSLWSLISFCRNRPGTSSVLEHSNFPKLKIKLKQMSVLVKWKLCQGVISFSFSPCDSLWQWAERADSKQRHCSNSLQAMQWKCPVVTSPELFRGYCRSFRLEMWSQQLHTLPQRPLVMEQPPNVTASVQHELTF